MFLSRLSKRTSNFVKEPSKQKIKNTIKRFYNSTEDLVQENISEEGVTSFFVNLTDLKDGVYYYNATVNDTAGNENSTETRVITLDNNPPLIDLISPTNATSSTTNSYNFTFNVTDANDVSNCSLIFDGSIINTLTSVNSGGTNGLYNSSLSIGTHSWSINCTDIAGNTGSSLTRTLIITEATTTSQTSFSGGGIPTFMPREEELKKGYQAVLQKNWKISFKLNNESHTFKIEDITQTTAKITISSKTQEATLSIGEEKKFEITGDDYYDVLVKLNSIDFTNRNYPRANITLQIINEKITTSQQIENKPQETTTPQTTQESKKGEKTNLSWLIWVVIAIIIVLVLVGIAYKKN